MKTILSNPMDETPRPRGRRARRLTTLSGSKLALIDISKPGGRVFLDRLSALLLARCGVAEVVRDTKPTFTKPAPEAWIERLAASRCDAVVEALAD